MMCKCADRCADVQITVAAKAIRIKVFKILVKTKNLHIRTSPVS